MRTRSKTIATLAYAAVFVLALVWTLGAALNAALAFCGAQERPAALALLHYAYGGVCHQMPDRSFQVAGQPLAVCARCFGIYAGYLIGLIIYPLARSLNRTDLPPRGWLLLALAPTAIDFMGGYAGLFETTLLSRAMTGSIAGTACAFYTLPGLVAMAAGWFKVSGQCKQEGGA